MQISVLNGVNLDMLGFRDPSVYGGLSIGELETQIYAWARDLTLTVRCQHTNHEGEYIEILELPFDDALAMATDGRIADAKTIMLLQWAALDGPFSRRAGDG